ncbi:MULTISPECIES: NUDIX hydrolase [unclassified Streptomyces]|uniref:NUDIX hydrolase n=1 Tax=unclassified Streptomyces TaxID=2593676 RepID=UPI000B8690F7
MRLARHVSAKGESNWTLPGGRVEHAEDPFGAVIREVAEETRRGGRTPAGYGLEGDTRGRAHRPWGPEHQNVGIFYQAASPTQLRHEPHCEIAGSVWPPIPHVAGLRRCDREG